MFVVARHKQRHAEGPHTTGLCSLLHDFGNLGDQKLCRRVLPVYPLVIRMCDFPRLVHQHPVVRANTGVHSTNVRCQQRHLRQRLSQRQWRAGLLLSGNYNTISGLDTKGGNTLLHRSQGIVNLTQLTAGGKSGQRE